MIPQVFEGQRVFIVGGGPSLRDFEFDRLAGKPTIAINRAYEKLPGATLLWWSDARFWRIHHEQLVAHEAPFKATALMDYPAEMLPLPESVTLYRFTGCTGFDDAPGCLRHGNNGAYAAMHLAAKLGAKKLVLLGIDMAHAKDGRTHWHDGHGVIHLDDTLKDLMLPWFKTLAKPLAQHGVEVLNASPDSRLTVWPRCSIEQGLMS